MGAFLRGKLQIGFGPLFRPMIFRAVELCRAEPVLPGKLQIVLDAKAALFGTVDHEKPAKRPEGLPANGVFAFLLQQDHLFAGSGQFMCGSKPRKARPDDNRIRIRHCASSPAYGP